MRGAGRYFFTLIRENADGRSRGLWCLVITFYVLRFTSLSYENFVCDESVSDDEYAGR